MGLAEGFAHPQRQSSLVNVRYVILGVTRTWNNVKIQIGKSPQTDRGCPLMEVYS